MSANTFRRFTYFITSDGKNLSETFASDTFNQLQSANGIRELNIYRKNNDYFIIIDADATLNSEGVFNALRHLESFESFKSILPEHDEALERIYKLDQKVIYTPTEGQLKIAAAPYKRFVWTLLLKEDEDLIAEYKRVHSMGQAWPEIAVNMKSVGVKDMEIYLYGTQAMLIMDTIPNFNLDKVALKWQKLPGEEEWQAYVSKFQRTDTDSSIQEKWQDMNAIL